MLEVLSESVRLVNLPFTALLGGLLLYWLTVALGLFHFDGGDLHADAGGDVHVGADAHGDLHADALGDLHADGHADAHGDTDGGGHDGDGLLGHVLHFVNIGEVPVMIVLSVLALWMWLFSMIANYYFNPGSILRALALVVPNLAVSAVLTRYVTWPLKKFFVVLNREYEQHKPLVGRTCTVTTSEVTGDFGQAQIGTRGAPLLINVRTSDGQPLCKGETGLVVREDKQRNLYYVVKVTADKLEA